MDEDFKNMCRRLDHLMAMGRSLPRAPDPRVCRRCGARDCTNPQCLRAQMDAEAAEATEQDRAFRERLAPHAEGAAREASQHRNGAGA
jgi:hypothetical protein